MKHKFHKITTDKMRSIASYTSYGVGRFMSDTHVVSEYGATPEILVLLWQLLYQYLPSTSEPHHMLWWLYNCKHYPTKKLLEKALRVLAPTSRKAMTPVKEGFLKIRHQVVRSCLITTQPDYSSFPLLTSLVSDPFQRSFEK